MPSRCLSGEEGGRDQPDGDAAEGAHDDGSRCKAGSGLTGSGSLSGEEGRLDQPDGDASEDAHG